MMEISFKKEDTHLVATCLGEWDAPQMTKFVMQMRDNARQLSCTRILADCRKLSAPPTEFHRFLAGQDVATFLPPPFKLAVLYVEELINHFGETTAVNRGADIHVYPKEEQALQWLLTGIAKTADADNTKRRT